MRCRPWVVVTAIVIVIVTAALGLLLGLLLGGRSAEVRTTLGMVSVFRFASLGLIIIGAQLHSNPIYRGPAITFALVGSSFPWPWPYRSAVEPERPSPLPTQRRLPRAPDRIRRRISP